MKRVEIIRYEIDIYPAYEAEHRSLCFLFAPTPSEVVRAFDLEILEGGHGEWEKDLLRKCLAAAKIFKDAVPDTPSYFAKLDTFECSKGAIYFWTPKVWRYVNAD